MPFIIRVDTKITLKRKAETSDAMIPIIYRASTEKFSNIFVSRSAKTCSYWSPSSGIAKATIKTPEKDPTIATISYQETTSFRYRAAKAAVKNGAEFSNIELIVTGKVIREIPIIVKARVPARDRMNRGFFNSYGISPKKDFPCFFTRIEEKIKIQIDRRKDES
jgi:hypothetical protein